VFVAAILDITERQRIDEELRDSRERAIAADRSKSEFLANMSHEIRTPMTAILGFNDIILDNLTDSDDIDAARTVKENGAYFITIMNDILDLSKIEAGKIDLECTLCSPREIVADVASLMGLRARSKNVPLEVRHDGPLPHSPLRFSSVRNRPQWPPATELVARVRRLPRGFLYAAVEELARAASELFDERHGFGKFDFQRLHSLRRHVNNLTSPGIWRTGQVDRDQTILGPIGLEGDSGCIIEADEHWLQPRLGIVSSESTRHLFSDDGIAGEEQQEFLLEELSELLDERPSCQQARCKTQQQDHANGQQYQQCDAAC
jgi:hypothetical protein